jgi:pimeloyl-ACP methyl ester carboxylesterase
VRPLILAFASAIAVFVAEQGSAQCQATVPFNQNVSGTLEPACSSTHRNGSYARYYTFTVSSAGSVTIDLTSAAFDAYLYLLNGNGTSGSVITSNDDSSGTNARISRTLSAGTYTVEATSYGAGDRGAFMVRVTASSGGGGGGGACQTTAALNQTIAGGLDSACASVHRGGAYARYYTFTLTSTSTVTIDLASGTFDTFLYLLNGSGSGGSLVTSNDDFNGTDSRISRSLAAGTYTAEATSYSAGRSGSFTLRIASADGGSGGGGGSCESGIGGNQTVNGSLDPSCTAAHRSGTYARYYTFSLAATSTVTIDLTSSVFDVYLILLNGGGRTGSMIASNDDFSGTDSRISRSLAAGTYTIEATSYDTAQRGAFTLRVASAGTGGGGGGSCQASTTPDQTLSGNLDSACTAVHRSGAYARYYTFSLAATTTVTIDLRSAAFDTYLFLLSGSGSSGSVVASNDDHSGTNSRISQNLNAGTYTIEATSYSPARSGAFTLQMASSAAGCSITNASVGQSVTGSLESSCTSTHRTGRYARYYSITLLTQTTVTIDLRAGFDTYLYLLDGRSTTGHVVDSNDDFNDSNSRVQRSLSAGTYTIEATSFNSATTGAFTLSIQAGSGRTMVFVIHGIGQTSADVENLTSNLRSALPPDRFTVDGGFTQDCANNPFCLPSCTVENGGRALAAYIARQAESSTDVILVGYSLGGLLARSAMVNNHDLVFSTRRVRGLVTLGTPNGGYPYCDRIDYFVRCGYLAYDMASQLRLATPTFSQPLFTLYTAWNQASSFVGQPGYWLAAGGTFCDQPLRYPACDWNSVANQTNGCRDANPDNDGVVCEDSALHRFGTYHQPDDRWSSSSYAHSSVILFNCNGQAFLLYDPPSTSLLFQRIVEAITDDM